MDRRGVVKAVEWIPLLIITMIAIVAIAMLVRHYSGRDVEAHQIAIASYLQRVYHDDLLMHEDLQTGRVYPGMIDESKLTPQVLDDIWKEDRKSGFGAISSHITIDAPCLQYEIYNNKETYEHFLPIARRGIMGPGGATMRHESLPVIIRGMQVCHGKMNITIVRPHS